MSKLIEKILSDVGFTLPNTVKKLNTEHWKNLDVNSIFKHKFVQKYRDKWIKLQDRYDKSDARKRYGGKFMHTGIEKRIVDVNDIYPGQIGVSEEGILEKVKGKGKDSSEIPEAILLYNEGKPIILLIDGHHRVAAAILTGQKNVELNLKVSDFF